MRRVGEEEGSGERQRTGEKPSLRALGSMQSALSKSVTSLNLALYIHLKCLSFQPRTCHPPLHPRNHTESSTTSLMSATPTFACTASGDVNESYHTTPCVTYSSSRHDSKFALHVRPSYTKKALEQCEGLDECTVSMYVPSITDLASTSNILGA